MKPSNKSIWQRIADDFKQKELISIKLLFLIHSSSQSVIYPYLSVFLTDLGINTEEIGILAFLISFLGIFLPPLTGILADRLGNFNKLVAVIMIAGGFASFGLLLVPKARTTIPYPQQLMVSVDCTNDGSFYFLLDDGEQCFKPSSKGNKKRNDGHADCTEKRASSKIKSDVSLHACGVICMDDVSSKRGAVLKHTKNYTVYWSDSLNAVAQSRQFDISGANFDLQWNVTTGMSKSYDGTVQAFNSSLYFFPTQNLFEFSCDNHNTFSMKIAEGDKQNQSCETIRFPSLTPVLRKDSVVGFSYSANKSEDMRCNGKTAWRTSVSVRLVDVDNNTSSETLSFKQCKPLCIGQIRRANQCNETGKKLDLNVALSLYSVLAGRVALAVISGTALAMTDGAIIGILRTRQADYGMQHVYASIGGMIAGQVSGLLIDAFSTGGSGKNYRPAFFFYAFLKIVSAVIMWNVNLEFKAPAKHVLKDVAIVFKKLEVISLLVVCLMYGISYGIVETYLFPFLRGLDASAGLLGNTILVGKLSGIPFIFFSGPILDYFGHANVLVFGFIVYAIRLAGYSIIVEAWQCLIFEMMESISVSLCFTALVTYAAKLSTTKTDTTIQGVVGGLYHAFGKGVGSLIGGYIIKAVCYRVMFRIFAVVTLVFSLSYFIFHRLCVPSKNEENENEVHASNESTNSLKMKDLNGTNHKLKGKINSAYALDEVSINKK